MGSLFLVQVAWAVEAVKIWLEQTVSKKVFLSHPTYIINKYTKLSNKNEKKMVGTYPNHPKSIRHPCRSAWSPAVCTCTIVVRKQRHQFSIPRFL